MKECKNITSSGIHIFQLNLNTDELLGLLVVRNSCYIGSTTKLTLRIQQPQTYQSPMANTFVMVCAVHRIIPFNWNLLSSAPGPASSAFIVSASWSYWTNQQPSRITVNPLFAMNLWIRWEREQLFSKSEFGHCKKRE